jgi:hypothetical protein
MPDQAPRTEETIRNEYLNICAQAGELQFKIGQMQAALTEVNGKLTALNQEYVTLKSTPAPKEEASEAPSVQPQP